ncbi:MAG TPA: EamA family transporter [bacterium]|jgi:drug/metabolite transporter (DMT)-like permease|nr:EamA family transporter [bacterium]
MNWIFLALASGVLNALWTSQVKPRVGPGGPLFFSAVIRWGVALLLLPWGILRAPHLSAHWWTITSLSGILESLSLFLAVRGYQKDYYATYSLSNINPLFVVLLAALFLQEPLGPSLLVGMALIIGGVLILYYRGHFSIWGLGAALSVSASKILSKMVIQESGPWAQASVAFLAGALFLTLLTALDKKPPAAKDWLKKLWKEKVLVVGSTLTTLCFFAAVARGPIGPVTLLSRVNLLVGFGLSYFGLQERKNWKGRAFGALGILAGITWVILKQG